MPSRTPTPAANCMPVAAPGPLFFYRPAQPPPHPSCPYTCPSDRCTDHIRPVPEEIVRLVFTISLARVVICSTAVVRIQDPSFRPSVRLSVRPSVRPLIQRAAREPCKPTCSEKASLGSVNSRILDRAFSTADVIARLLVGATFRIAERGGRLISCIAMRMIKTRRHKIMLEHRRETVISTACALPKYSVFVDASA